jgi:hypothetical protein
MSAALKLDLSAYSPAIQNSQPNLTAFCPDGIPYQRDVIDLIREDWDYGVGTLEILLSGSYGSSKSVLLAHLVVSHCLENPRAVAGICRRTMPDLKGTLFKEIVDHIENALDEDGEPQFIEGKDYWVSETTAKIRFKNKSEIIPICWGDRRYKKLRSLKLSMLAIEEGTENDDGDKEGFLEAKARLRRLPHVRENVLIVATNPDSPSHWLYDYFIEPNEGGRQHKTRRVFYSLTEQNIYLDPVYIQQLNEDLDPKRALRYLKGRWIELSKEQIYYCYDTSNNYRDYSYEIDERLPIFLTWDFNIGMGKPLSMALGQYDGQNDEWHWFAEVVIEGARTLESVREVIARGYLDKPVPKFIVCGDASGKARDTRSNINDYELIMEELELYLKGNERLERWVPLSNPEIRKRHNTMNAYFENNVGRHRSFVYKDAPTLHKGFRLASLRKGADYIEDDSAKCPWQHVTTAVGYATMAVKIFGNAKPQQSRTL